MCLTVSFIKSCWLTGPVEEPLIKLYLHQDRKCIDLKLEEYIVGTVAAEMPASFDIEALKAQAVCARTYALRKLVEGKEYPQGADLSDDITSCQAYISPAEFQKLNPLYYKNLLNKIKEACNKTRGLIMVYDGEPIDALYHSTCGGQTESASEAWGNEVPYLHSVKCPYCKDSKRYKTSGNISLQDLRSFAGTNKRSIVLRVADRSPSGRVKRLEINDQPFSAEKFRQYFNLPSTWWQFENNNEALLIQSRGYGHGIGLCQYGANGMAKAGHNYRDILNKYYQDIDFCKMEWKSDPNP
ncbi:MAG: stage II sporulation protein D [Syntrophomonas sp.]